MNLPADVMNLVWEFDGRWKGHFAAVMEEIKDLQLSHTRFCTWSIPPKGFVRHALMCVSISKEAEASARIKDSDNEIEAQW